MNKKNNQRAQDTDERIIRAVHQKIVAEHKPVSKITVREICEEAGINRSTFYAHYMDIYDVVEKVEKQMSKMLTSSILELVDHASSVNSIFEQVFAFVAQYKEFYQMYFGEMHQSGVINVAWEMLSDKTQNIPYQELGYQNQKELKYAGAFFVSGLTAILRLWVEDGCQETPAEMVQILERQYMQSNREIFLNWNREE